MESLSKVFRLDLVIKALSIRGERGLCLRVSYIPFFATLNTTHIQINFTAMSDLDGTLI